jgi:hypothetical protein
MINADYVPALGRGQEFRVREALRRVMLRTGRDDARKRDDFVDWLRDAARKHVLNAQTGGPSRLVRQIRSDIKVLRTSATVLERHARINDYGRKPGIFFLSGPNLAKPEAAKTSAEYLDWTKTALSVLDDMTRALGKLQKQIEGPAPAGRGEKSFVRDWHNAIVEKYTAAVGVPPTAADATDFEVILGIAREAVALSRRVSPAVLQALLSG